MPVQFYFLNLFILFMKFLQKNISIKYILFIFLFNSLFFSLAEIFTFFYNKNSNKQYPLFYNYKIGKYKINEFRSSFKYNKLDPFLGWGYDSIGIATKYKLKNNCIFLSNYVNKNDTLKIFITGGSTSDVFLFDYNYPIYLYKKIIEQKINFEIYIGAVGGYGTSQELLKLIRDGIAIQPDIHISYHGANDYDNPYYSTEYIKDILSNTLENSNSSKLFPNIYSFLKNILRSKENNFDLKLIEFVPNPLEQWTKNMNIMYGISKVYNYKFHGILQPVAGIGNLQQIDKDSNILGYKIFYPYAKNYIQEYRINYLHDFTKIYDGITNMPFIDDCHPKEAYQNIIADSIFRIIVDDAKLLNSK